MTRCVIGLVFFVAALAASCAEASDANRFAYLDEFLEPYYVSQRFPKLTTPQWVSKPGVEAVVVFAIDDMRDTARYENYLRPILERLKKIDGRAPVSIMTNRADPKDPQLQRWLKEGLSIEVHTYDHPCPCLQKGDFAAARTTYDRCVDLMNQIEGNSPVAFRMPCCDSLNTPSPRFFAEIFNRTTPAKNFLSIDSSVFQVFTANDPDLPESLVLAEEGANRFRKYIPFPSFVNTIENYPYPYIIGGKCWQFPCMVPSDWEAQNLHRPNNPLTVRDMKAALDATVIKKGVFNLVFHPHGWIRNDQVIELIDHAQRKHGDKVLFLTFREALEQLNSHLLNANPIRDASGDDHGVRLLDLNNDGYLDVVIANKARRVTRVWDPKRRRWVDSTFPVAVVAPQSEGRNADAGVRFSVVEGDPVAIAKASGGEGAWRWRDGAWRTDAKLLRGLESPFAVNGARRGARFLDVDGDSRPELIIANEAKQQIYRYENGRWSESSIVWPDGARIVDSSGRDAGLRFVDIDQDGRLDLLFSDESQFSLHLWNPAPKSLGWSIAAAQGARGDENAIPMIARNGTNNGAWFHSDTLWIQNEDTHRLPNLVDRRRYADMLPEDRRNFPPPKTTAEALRSFKVSDGLKVELAAAEPLVTDPIAIDFGFDGSLWVAEMGDYPNGVDDVGGSAGRVRQLWDDDGDGRFDRSTVFLDKLPFPTGVKAWRDGVLITAAPDLLFALDKDGDGKADEVKKLYTGFRPGNQQHRVNGMRWGLDNWLYLANGDSGGEVRHVPSNGEAVNIRGRDLRIRPDDGLLDPLAGQTQYGRNRDDWGNWFGGNNSNPMWQYVLEDFITRRNRHVSYGNLRPNVYETPGASPVFPRSRTLARFNDFNKSNRFTSACSPIIYRDRRLGDRFLGDVFVCEPVHNLVHREKARYEGARLISRRAADEQSSEFLASTDNWFRPTMVRTGPDGALWVVDMYRFVIEHPEWIPQDWQKRLTLRAGNDRGRIYRITPLRESLAQPEPIADLRGDELVAVLESDNGARRDMAHQQLLWNRDPATIPALRETATHSERPLARLHAICTLAGMDALAVETLRAALEDSQPGVRRWAVRWAGAHQSRNQLRSNVIALANDPDARVRIECAIALGEYGDDRDAAGALARLAVASSDDPYLRAAVLSSLHERNLGAVAGAVIENSADAQEAPEILAPLLSMASAIGANDVWRDAIRGADAADAPDWTIEAAVKIASQLNRGGDKFDDPKTAALYRPLLRNARVTLNAGKASIRRRAAALQLLGVVALDESENRKVMLSVLNPRSPIELQRIAVQSLGAEGSKPSLDGLFTAWRQATPIIRNEMLDAIIARESWTRGLLGRIEAGAFEASALSASRRQQLRTHRNTEIRGRALALFKTSTSQQRGKLIQDYLTSANRKGDAAKGRQVFVKKCANCHRLEGVGHVLGPDLAALTNRSNQAMITALLAPNASVEDKYLNYTVLFTDGRQAQGILQAETATTLTLAAAEGKTIEVLRRDVDELASSGKSLMPEGMEKEVPKEQIADLLAYLKQTGPPPKSFPGNKPRLVTPRDDGSIHLFATESRIFGPSVVLESKYGNLGFWASPGDRAVWSADVPRAGRYKVTIDYACANDVAGDRFVIEVAGQSVGGVVKGTGSWDQYQRVGVGVVTLPKGPVEMTFRSDGPIDRFLIDLRGLMLHPQ